ncbi:Di-sulfide bridge nucleocytoplasmic transport domain-containing protein [Peziza echinospora]|nr:Di-sulfide bridge nucleocytoplasmic transport domain-containing protein [Peziza echinospora]
MERRTNESPMDFEWERKTIDPNSPFQLGLSSLRGDGVQNFRAQNSFASPTKPTAAFGAPQSVFSTPSNQIFGELGRRGGGMGQQPPPATPLFQTASRNLFAQHQQHQQQNEGFHADPFKQSSSSTSSNQHATQSPGQEMDISETPDSTPRAPATSTAVAVTSSAADELREQHNNPHNQHEGHNTPHHTNNRMDILSTTTERISGRGELRRGKFAEASGKRIHKRKVKSQVERDFWVSSPRRPQHYDDEDEDEDGTSDEHSPHNSNYNNNNQQSVISRKKSSKQSSSSSSSQHYPTNGGHSKWDHHFPVLASSYLQLAFNIVMVSSIVYIIISFVRTIQADVDTNVRLETSKILVEIQECQYNYLQNKCDLAQRLPLAQELCTRWEMCMNRNPEEVGRAKISAHTFATIANSLIEPISYKFMVFFTTLFIGGLWATNSAFGSYRRKMQEAHYAHPVHSAPPPPTPSQAQLLNQQQQHQQHQQQQQQLPPIDLSRWAHQANIYPPPPQQTPGRGGAAVQGGRSQRQVGYY